MLNIRSLLIAAALFFPCLVQAEELDQIFKRVNEFVAQKNFPKALEELQWAEKAIQKMNSGRVENFFPDSIAGFMGEKIQNSTALGFTNIEREYVKGGSRVKISLTGGGNQAGFGGLAALGKMAAMMGGTTGQEAIRISGRTAMLNESSGSPELSVYLDSGSILMISSVSKATSADLRSIADGINIEELDKYLRGA